MIPNTAQRLALNLDSHIVIDAGAGTGKTKTIIDRVIEHYLCGDQRATRILPVPERPPPLRGGVLISPPFGDGGSREPPRASSRRGRPANIHQQGGI